MNKYKVIWFDDEFEDLDIIKEKASLNGITLVGYNNAKEGLDALFANMHDFDAAIVDGKFCLYPGQASHSLNDDALGEVAKALLKASDTKILPWFILSGQASFTKHINKHAHVFKNNKVYDKTNDDHLDALWRDLKSEADAQLDTQIRHEYYRVFEACTGLNSWEDVDKPLLDILKCTKMANPTFQDALYFNRLRIILECMFRAANKSGLLHDNCVDKGNGAVNLSESTLFLSGLPTKHLGVQCKKSHFPKIISEAVRSILFITGAASHTTDPGINNNYNIAKYRRSINTPYLIFSLTFQLLDVLIWFSDYSKQNPDPITNKVFWTNIEDADGNDWQKGKVVNVNPKGFAFFQPARGSSVIIPPPLVDEHDLADNDSVMVTTEEYQSKNNEIKTRVNKLRKINER